MVKRMEMDNRKLAKTVKEMQQFLSDYGLTWVGDSPEEEANAGTDAVDNDAVTSDEQKPSEANVSMWLPETSLAESSPASAPTPPAEDAEHIFEFEMTKLQARIAELNIVAGEGTSDVEKNSHGEFKLKKREYIELCFWKNGFQVNGAPVRSYVVPINRAFVQDILDGYFPYELKEKYPDGVPFTVLDHSFEHYHRPFSQAGQGRQLCSRGKVGQNVSDVTAADSKTRAKEQEEGNPDAFLARLPKNVIRNGKIVPVRAAVEEMVKPKEQDTAAPQIVHIDGTKDADEEQTVRDGNAAEKAATLQIKSADMQRTFVMRFPYSATIAHVLHHLAQQGEIPSQCEKDGVLPQYHLQTTFPKNTLTDTSLTLQSAGLVPNCALLLIKS